MWSRGALSRLFKGRGKQTGEAESSTQGAGQLALPEYPKVRAEGSTVEILWEPSKIEIWGEEDSAFDARSVAFEMEMELRSTAYVKKRLNSYIDEVFDELLRLDVPRSIAKTSIENGHYSIHKVIVQLDGEE